MEREPTDFRGHCRGIASSSQDNRPTQRNGHTTFVLFHPSLVYHWRVSRFFIIPADFRQRFVDVCGQKGVEMLAHLPERVEEWEGQLRLKGLRLVDGLSYNLVFFGETMAGRPVVLKAAPESQALASEAAALQGFGSDRAAAVIEARLDEGLLVTERLQPGTQLSRVATEREALDVVVRLFSNGWPAPNPLVDDDVAAFTRSLDRLPESSGPLDPGLLREAMDVRRTLLADSTEARLLHGDLHYDNILADERRGYRLIDPKGLLGDPLFDLGYLVSRVQPLGCDALPLRRAVELRLDVLAEAFGCEARRLAAWSFVAAALSAIWTLEDHAHVSDDEIDVLKLLGYPLQG